MTTDKKLLNQTYSNLDLCEFRNPFGMIILNGSFIHFQSTTFLFFASQIHDIGIPHIT